VADIGWGASETTMTEHVWEQFSEIVRSMGAAEGLMHTLESAVVGAQEIIVHADHAAVSLVHQYKRIETPAATDDIARRGDQLQYEVGEGPCLQSIREQETVSSRDLLYESRWPHWSRRAAEELGVRSMLCLQLFVTHDTLGALNLYSDHPDAFDADDRATGLALAAHVAVALTSEQNAENHDSSLAGAAVIGQAQGVLMQRYELTPSEAFLVLAKASQRGDNTLRQVAARLIENAVDRRGEASNR
jgi:GAF domain-containing protein